MVCNAVCNLSAKLIELFATLIDIIFRLSLQSHRGEERLDCGIKLALQLRVHDLDLGGHLQRVDAVNVVQLMQHQSGGEVD
jgi:hypothetical protein